MSKRVVFALTAVLLGLVTIACAGAPVVTPTPATTAIPSAAAQTPTPTPTSVPSTAPTATTIPEPTATAAVEYPEMPSAACCRGRDLDAGRYAFPGWLDIPLTVDVPDGWRVLNERSALLFLIGRGQNVQLNPSEMLLFLDATDRGTPQSIIDGITGVPQLTVVTEASDVTFAGLDGVQADLAALPNPDFEGVPAADIPPGVQYLPVIESYLTPGFAWTTSTPEARVRTIALTVGDQILLIYVEGPGEGFDSLTADAATILGSLELINP